MLQSDCPAEPNSPTKRRRIRAQVLRIGILGAFLAALCGTLVSFALFGCECNRMPEMQVIHDDETPPTEKKDARPPVPR